MIKMAYAYYRVGKEAQERKERILERWKQRVGMEDKLDLTESLIRASPFIFAIFLVVLGMVG